MNEREKTLLTPEEQERRHQVAEQRRRKARAERARKKRRAEKIKLTIGIVFVTLLTAAAVFIITRYVLPDAGKDARQPKTSPSEEQTSSSYTTQTPTTAPEPTHDYPELKSKNGTFSTYSSGAIRVDNAAFSVCGTLSDSVTSKYAALVSEVADSLNGKTKVYSLIIPTSYGVTLPDDIKTQIANYADQGENIAKVFSKMSENVTPVFCYDDLMTHRDEYLYFRTDHHWNGKGARITPMKRFAEQKASSRSRSKNVKKKSSTASSARCIRTTARTKTCFPQTRSKHFCPSAQMRR